MVRSRSDPARRARMKARVKVWLEIDDEYVFGFGLSEILKAVDSEGSIKAAATMLGKSYRYVWGRIKTAEKAVGERLVLTRVGGEETNRSALTERARQLVTNFDSLRQRTFHVVEQEFSSRFAATGSRDGART